MRYETVGNRQVLLTPSAWSLLMLVVLFAAGGASCPRLVQQYTQPLPRALPPNATLGQVMDVVNQNSAQVQTLYSNRATLSSTGFPSLRATLVYQRARNLRLRGDTALTGPEVDLGSNDELFWFWVKRNQPPAFYFCRHDRYATSGARQILPIEPQWLVQALGIVSFEPNEQHQGPIPIQADRLEIRSTNPAMPGSPPRVTIIDAARGVVLEEHAYDAQGRLVASARLSGHVRDPFSQVVLPRHVEIQWPAARFEISLDVADLQINRLGPEAQALFARPHYPGYPDVDLADPNLVPAQAQSAPAPRTAAAPLNRLQR